MMGVEAMREPDETLYIGPDERDVRWYYEFEDVEEARRFKDALREQGRWAWVVRTSGGAEVIERP